MFPEIKEIIAGFFPKIKEILFCINAQRYDKGCHKAAYCAASEQYTFLLERERDHAAA